MTSSLNPHRESRFARWVAGPRTKWITIAVWLVLAGLLSALLPSASSQENNNAANLDESYASVQGELVAAREFPNEAGIPGLVVLKHTGGLSDAELGKVQSLVKSLDEKPLPHQESVVPFHKLPPEVLKSRLSKDGAALVLPVFFEKSADTDALKESITALKERAASVFGYDPFQEGADGKDRLSARMTGPAGIQVDAVNLFKNADVSLLLGTVLLVLVFLLLIYRSPILALIPLIAVGFAYATVNPLIGWMAREGWITVDSQALSIMTVLLFGAGTDYCLFLVSRFRQLLRSDRDKARALYQSLTDTTGAIAMSGFTVVMALLALLLAEFGAYDRFAIPFSLSIFIMGIASLTLVPALLAVFGRASFYPFIPRTQEMIEERAARLGKPVPVPKPPRKLRFASGVAVTRRPWTITLATLVILGSLAAFAPRIVYTFDTLSSFPKDMESREGFQIISEQFNPGELAPVKLMVDTKGKPAAIAEALKKLPFVSKVSEPVKGKTNPNLVSYDVELAMNPYSNEAMDRIPDLRGAAEKALADAGISGAADLVWISGQTIEQYDTRETGDRDASVVIPVVIVLIALLLLVYLRSIVAMIYLMGTVLLSYFSALGLGWLIIHYGMGADAIQGFIPLYAFVFLVALGEDYNIFMISSIWRKSRTIPLKTAIREGVSETGSVITSAGLILAGTFAVLATLPIQILVHFGIITAVGVLLDTFVVRPYLVPSLTVLFGRWAFWPVRYKEPAEAVEAEAAASTRGGTKA
ncbi:MMPL family transporter [Gorillibacterium sp. sgz5001074]|uniref:MMPL family transporter n=1 Tax=Gorillibacterium sp. sgz5001074 TaxID=3446695 RepID=UPI003F66B631